MQQVSDRPQTGRERVLELIQGQSVVTPDDLRKLGIRTALLGELARDGVLEHVDRGVYYNPEYPITEHHSLVEAVARMTRPCVVCLLSALRFHDLGTQAPPKVWLTVERTKTNTPRSPRALLPLHVTLWDTDYFVPGQVRHLIEGREVLVYDVAKTLVDCFRLRDQIGLSVFLEALSDAWQHRRFEMATLLRYAGLGRKTVTDEIRPYLQGL